MWSVELPLSKSLLNRLLVLSALKGDSLPCFASQEAAQDSLLLQRILQLDEVQRRQTGKCSGVRNLDNCGTALRFLLPYYASQAGSEVVLTGSERLQERPIAPLVEALRTLGANIVYLQKEGFAPLRIIGQADLQGKVVLNDPLSTQFVSALLLLSAVKPAVQVESNCRSPYVQMTEQVIARYPQVPIERDWSSAAFWLEYVALHKPIEPILLPQLTLQSEQGDAVAVSLFASLGVRATQTDQGVVLESVKEAKLPQVMAVNFTNCPDLYPAFFVACWRLGVEMNFTGLERLPLKESNRLLLPELVSRAGEGEVDIMHDHRLAMALLVAGVKVNDTACIVKSYPQFMSQWKRITSL